MRVLLIAALLLATSSSFAKTAYVSLMNYNVENLFDTTHDEGKADHTYMPKAVKDRSPEIQKVCRAMTDSYYRSECLNVDWTQEKLNKKIDSLSRVIRDFNNGRGPDILVLQEVENLNVLTMLRDRGLRGLGYKYVILIEGEDERGIDVGMISRYPVLQKKLHTLNLIENGKRIKTRGILEATFSINGEKLTVFGNHWPSQGKPASVRAEVARQFMEIAKKAPSANVVALGDFNTLDSDNPHGINTELLDRSKPFHFFDTREVLADYCSHRPYPYDLNPGSHWYRGEWSYLDKILVANRTKYAVSLKPVWCSFDVFVRDYALQDKKWTNYDTGETTIFHIPHRFDFKTAEGWSDHLPVTFVFKLDY